MLNFQLSPPQLELQRKAREFALKEILPLAWYYDEIDETPLEVLQKAHAAGLINGDIPEEYGGKGWGLIESVVLTEELAAACPGLATTIFDNSLGMEPLVLSKNESLKKRYFSEILKDFKLICFATSEPTMGSDVAGIRCRAERDGNDYILNGTKYWITNGGISDYMSVFATVDPDSQHEGICAFLVERSWEGVSIGRKIPKMGQRGSNTTGINFKDVRVPAENILAPPGEGFMLAMQTFARTRPAFGARISDFQAIQHKIAEMYQKVETSRLLVWKAAWEADQGLDPTIAASIAKFYSTETCLEVANEALQIFAGYGYTKMFPIEKLLRDARLFRIYEGTSEVQRYIVSGYALHAYQPVMPPLDELPIHRDLDPTGTAGTPDHTAWRCRICGYVHYGESPPEECPYCFFPDSAFKEM